MMSFYSPLNQQQRRRHRQIVIDNKKTTLLNHSPHCHDNCSFLPDTATSPTIERQLPMVLPSATSSTTLNSRCIVTETFQHVHNKAFPPVRKTPDFQNPSATSPTTAIVTAAGTPLKNWQLLDDTSNSLLSSEHKNPHSNNSDDNNNASSVVSHDDVGLTIEDNLPVIMHNLCIDGHYKITASSSVEKDPINNLTSLSKPQQQQQQIADENGGVNTRRDIINVTAGDISEQHKRQGNKKCSYYTNNMPPAICFQSRMITLPSSSLSITTTRQKGKERSSDISMNDQQDLIDTWSIRGCTPPSPPFKDRRGDAIMFAESDEEQQLQHENDYFQFEFPSDDGGDTYGNSSKKKGFGRMRRSATNDERMFKSADIQPEPLPRCRSIDCGDYTAATPGKSTKSRSKRKLLKRSVSLGFSKFKLISSNFNLRTHRRLPDDDIMIDIKETEYQTSRRKNTFTDQSVEAQATVEKILNSGNAKDICPSKYPLLRSLSAPETLDQDTDDYDEDISELYLPRRRAICPNLPVPAMKQLKTYLILTRLKQYCFV